MKRQNEKGFTLIEMMVSLSLFTIVVTIAVGAFLSLIGSSKGIQSKQSVMTTLTFVLDSMTREIRTGTNYYCNNSTLSGLDSQLEGLDCASGANGISFIESGSSLTGTSNRIAYYYDSTSRSIMRRIGNGQAQSIVSQGITITNVDFFVTGTDRLGDGVTNSDAIQPTVTIVLEAQDDAGASTTLQTTVTQRELDI